MTAQEIFHFLLTYRYPMLLVASTIEGPIVTIIGAFLSTLGYLNLFFVFWIVLAGDIFGDMIHYAIGRWGGAPLLNRWGHHIGVTEKRFLRLKQSFHTHPRRTLFTGKLLQGVGAMVLQAAGAVKMPLKTFVWYNLIASIPKALFLIAIGYFFGYAYVDIDNYLGYITIGTMLLSILVVVIYLRSLQDALDRSEDEGPLS